MTNSTIKHKTVGLLYLENAEQFHGTHVNVIPFKPIKIMAPNYTDFYKTLKNA